MRNLGSLAALLWTAGVLGSGCTYTVNSTADSVDVNPGNRTCADAQGRCTLRAAIMESNATAATERIEVPAGTYSLTLPTASGGGPLVVSSSVSIRGVPGATIVNSGAVNYEGEPGCPVSGSERSVFRINGGTVGLSYLTIQGGYAQNGGGLFINGGTVEITDSLIRRNAAFTGAGGILVNNGVVRIRRTTIRDNCATGAFGGGANIQPGAELWVYESLFTNNRSNRAGAIRNSGLLNLRATTVTGNVADSPGAGTGGISQNGFAFLNSVTLTDNTGFGRDTNSFLGGGLQTTSSATTVVKNSIIGGNNGQGGPNDCAGPLTSDSRWNLIGDTLGCGLPANTSSYVLNSNPLLGPLTANGGPTQTHALQTGSPARAAAYQFPQPAADGCEPRDQRGVPKPQGARCDIGAFEADNANVFVTSFILVDADTNADLFQIRNGELLNRSALPDNLSIRVQLNGTAGSVVFGLDGNPSVHNENNAPYGLGGDDPAGDFQPATIPSGEHVLRATPFAGPNGTGASGGSLELRYYAIGGP